MHEQRRAAQNTTGHNTAGRSGLPAIIEGAGARQYRGAPASFAAQTFASQGSWHANDHDQWRPGPSARLAAAHAYCANAKRMVRRLPAGARRALSA